MATKFCVLLLGDAKTSQIPFIFSTSMSEVIDKAAALKMGADDYLIKPFDMKSLLAVVESRMLAGKRQVHEIEASFR
ncbi:MAG: hypothetical protein IPM82_21070 [Saprospiraceae bacterium]|nr:hypothetical protein [Saprospiraceae bacterium]